MRPRAESRLIPRFEARGTGSQVTYLHSGAICFAADKRGGDVCVRVLIIQVYHIGHAAWQEQLIAFIRLASKQCAVHIAAYKKEDE